MIQVRLKTPIRRIRTDNGTEFVNQTLREYYEKVGISHETSVAHSPQQNGVIERRNHTLIEAACTMLIYAKAPLFLWAEAVATACYTQNRSIIRLRHGKTPYGLLHEKLPDLSFFHVFSALCYPTNDSENLALFDELLNPSSSDDCPAPEVISLIAEVVALELVASTDSPSSTTVDQDTPSPNVAHMNNDPFFGIPILENDSEASSSSDIIPTVMQTAAPNSERRRERKYMQSQPTVSVNQDNMNHVYKLKKALYGLKQAPRAWYDLLSKFLLSQEFSKGTVDPTLFIRKQGKDILLSKYALESLKKYGMESSDLVDTPMVEKSKLDEDTQGKAVDPTHCRGMIGTLISRRSTSDVMQLLGDRLGYLVQSKKGKKSTDISSKKAKYIAMSGCCAQILWMRSQLTDYGLGFNKIPMYYDNKSAIALCCNNIQHSRSNHIDIRFHFIKEQVKIGSG
ncbi:integrase, catalytic region, zinc finger, CCHC-type containing protein [Tanacetum coccineum]